MAEPMAIATQKFDNLNLMPDRLGMWEWKRETQRIKLSPGACKMFGIGSPELSSLTLEAFLQLIHFDDRALVASALSKTLYEGAFFKQRFQILRSGGEVGCLQGEAEALPIATRPPALVTGVFFDATTYLRKEENLRASEERYRLSFESSSVGFIMYDSDNRMLEVNDAFCRMSGFARQELIGCLASDITHEEDRSATIEIIKKLNLTRNQSYSTEKRYVKKNGDTLWARVSGIRQHLANNNLTFSLVIDITDQKHAQELLAQKKRELAQLGRVYTLSNLITGIGHEINQPLAAVSNFSSALVRSLEKIDLSVEARAPLQQMAEAIYSQTMRVGEIIRRMKRLAAKSVPQTMPHLINALVHEVVALIEAEATFHQVSFVLDLCEDLPLIDMDPIQIEQVILNLIRNAIEAIAQSNSVHRVVTVRTFLDPNGVRVTIGDTGPGFGKCQIGQMFDALYTTKKSGSGMGLSISRTIIEAHNGVISVEESQTGGAVFAFILPLRRET
jgi:two-component system sensor kinase FixL